MFEHVNPKNGQAAPLISKEVYDIIMKVGTPKHHQPGHTPLGVQGSQQQQPLLTER
jgi:hypothetical protein